MKTYPFAVIESQIDTTLNMYLTRYLKALNFKPSEQMEAPVVEADCEASPQTKLVYLSAIDYSVQKYTGYLILDSLCHIYNIGASKELRNALSNVLVFSRTKNPNNTTPYSMIQSILIPDLFYIELGNFNVVDLHLEDSNGQISSPKNLEYFKHSGFLPLDPTDMKNAKKMTFYPGGSNNSRIPNGEYSHDINHEKQQLITPHI